MTAAERHGRIRRSAAHPLLLASLARIQEQQNEYPLRGIHFPTARNMTPPLRKEGSSPIVSGKMLNPADGVTRRAAVPVLIIAIGPPRTFHQEALRATDGTLGCGGIGCTAKTTW